MINKIDPSQIKIIDIPVMEGATDLNDGKSGLVPIPTKDNPNAFLCADGTWKTSDNNKIATTDTLGNIIVGDNLSIDDNGKLNAKLPGGQYTQSTKLDMIAPQEVKLDIGETSEFIFPPVEVLKMGDITPEVTLSEMSFDQGDSIDFEYNSTNVGFNEVMYPKTDIQVPCTSILEPTSKKYLLVSENINIDNYKNIQSYSNPIKAKRIITGLDPTADLTTALGLSAKISISPTANTQAILSVKQGSSTVSAYPSSGYITTKNFYIADGSTGEGSVAAMQNVVSISLSNGTDSATVAEFNNGDLFDFNNIKKSTTTNYIVYKGTELNRFLPPCNMATSNKKTVQDLIDGITSANGKIPGVSFFKNGNDIIVLYKSDILTLEGLDLSSLFVIEDITLKSVYVNDNKAYGIFSSDETNTFKVLANNWSDLSDNEKINLIDSTTEEAIPFETISSVLSEFEINSVFVSNSESYTLKAIPYSELILPKKLISTNRFYSLNNVTMVYNIAGVGTIYMAVTNNLNKYYIYDNATENWKEVSSTVDSIKQGNMHITNIASIPTSAWNSLIRRNDSKGIAFAYVLDINDYTDKAEVDSMTFNVDISGEWSKAIYGTDFTYSYSNTNLIVMILEDGNYKINYCKSVEEN